MDLQQRMQQDLDFLKQTFPHSQEQFPDGRWAAKVTSGEGDECVGSYCISLGFDVDRTNILDQWYEVYVPLLLIDVCDSRHELARYAVEMGDGENFYLPTIRQAVEFIGRISRALTPVSVATEE